MSLDQVIQIITQLGLPAVALWVLAKWTGSRIDRAEAAAANREDALTAKVDSLEKDLRGLEKEVREKVVPVLAAATKALERHGAP